MPVVCFKSAQSGSLGCDARILKRNRERSQRTPFICDSSVKPEMGDAGVWRVPPLPTDGWLVAPPSKARSLPVAVLSRGAAGEPAVEPEAEVIST